MDKKEEHEEAEITGLTPKQANHIETVRVPVLVPGYEHKQPKTGGRGFFWVDTQKSTNTVFYLYSSTISFSNPCFRVLMAGYESGADMGAKWLEVAHKPRVTYQNRQV